MDKLKQLIESWKDTGGYSYALELETCLKQLAEDPVGYLDVRFPADVEKSIDDHVEFYTVGDKVILQPLFGLPAITVRVTEDGYEQQ